MKYCIPCHQSELSLFKRCYNWQIYSYLVSFTFLVMWRFTFYQGWRKRSRSSKRRYLKQICCQYFNYEILYLKSKWQIKSLFLWHHLQWSVTFNIFVFTLKPFSKFLSRLYRNTVWKIFYKNMSFVLDSLAFREHHFTLIGHI